VGRLTALTSLDLQHCYAPKKFVSSSPSQQELAGASICPFLLTLPALRVLNLGDSPVVLAQLVALARGLSLLEQLQLPTIRLMDASSDKAGAASMIDSAAAAALVAMPRLWELLAPTSDHLIKAANKLRQLWSSAASPVYCVEVKSAWFSAFRCKLAPLR
jgi:hypothetical protein